MSKPRLHLDTEQRLRNIGNDGGDGDAAGFHRDATSGDQSQRKRGRDNVLGGRDCDLVLRMDALFVVDRLSV